MSVSRRSILRTAAWSAPAITLAAAAPAFADSTPIRKDPGINGWVLVSWNKSTEWINRKWKTFVNATFDSDPSGYRDNQTPDGALFGLYIYDTQPGDLFSAGSITLWFRGKVGSWSYGSRSNTSNGGGHGRGWSSPVYVGTQSKPDGKTYHGYRFDYSGEYTLSGGLVWLQDMEVKAHNIANSNGTYWVERHVAINGEVHAFQRRNGEDGPLGEGFPVGTSRARSFAHPSGLTGVMA